MSNVFWSSTQPDPKRQYRFVVIFADSQTSAQSLDRIPNFVAKTVTKPKITVSTVPHMFLDHEFKFPGRVTWDPISITMVDPGGKDDIAAALMSRLGQSGYKYPDTSAEAVISLSKNKSAGAVGDVSIAQLDAEGRVAEQWTLKNCFITSLDFGGLDYSSDELSEISLELTYDWATLNDPSVVAEPAADLRDPNSNL
jgi:hypothetical protein